MFHALLNALTTLLAIAVISPCAEATDCTQVTDLLENCDQWTACVNSVGVGCYNPQGEPDAGL